MELENIQITLRFAKLLSMLVYVQMLVVQSTLKLLMLLLNILQLKVQWLNLWHYQFQNLLELFNSMETNIMCVNISKKNIIQLIFSKIGTKLMPPDPEMVLHYGNLL